MVNYREIENARRQGHNERGEAIGGRDMRATGRAVGNEVKGVHFKESGVLREEGGSLRVTVRSKPYKAQKHFKHFRPKEQEKTTSNMGIQRTWQFLRGLSPSLYFYPRERKCLSSGPILLRIILGLGVKLSS